MPRIFATSISRNSVDLLVRMKEKRSEREERVFIARDRRRATPFTFLRAFLFCLHGTIPIDPLINIAPRFVRILFVDSESRVL